jgi:hypothetical protein
MRPGRKRLWTGTVRAGLLVGGNTVSGLFFPFYEDAVFLLSIAIFCCLFKVFIKL